MITAGQWLRHARKALAAAGVESSRLDAELLLMHAWDVDRTSLITHSMDALPDEVEVAVERLLERRCQREPLAYLVGNKEFWSREFEVGPGVLIPRPETEHLVESVLARFSDHGRPWRFADIGTDSALLDNARNIADELLRDHPEVAQAHLQRWMANKHDYLHA